MLTEEIKNQLIVSMQEAFARVLAQAGLSTEEVNQIITDKLATDDDFVNGVGSKLATPATVLTAIAAAFTESAGTAHDSLKTIEGLATALGNDPDTITNIVDALSNKADSSAVTQALSDLSDSINAEFASLKAPKDFGAAENVPFLSNDPVVYNTLELGFYQGYAKASQLGITQEVVTIAELNHDPVMSVVIQVFMEGNVKAVRRFADSGFRQYTSMLSPKVLVMGKSPVQWHTDNPLKQEMFEMLDVAGDCDLIGAVRGAMPEADVTTPNLDTMRSNVVSMQAANGRVGEYFSGIQIVPGQGRWYALSGNVADFGSNTALNSMSEADTIAYYEGNGLTVHEVGTFLADATSVANGVTEWKVETLSGSPKYSALSTNWTRLQANTMPASARVNIRTTPDDMNAYKREEASIRISVRNRDTLEATETVIHLGLILDTARAPVLLHDKYMVGRWTYPPVDEWVYGSNTLGYNTLHISNGEVRLMTMLQKEPNFGEQVNLFPDANGLYKINTQVGEVNNFGLAIGMAYDGNDGTPIYDLYDIELLFESAGQNDRKFIIGDDGGDIITFDVDGDGQVSALANWYIGDTTSSGANNWQELKVTSTDGTFNTGLYHIYPLAPTATDPNGKEVKALVFDVTITAKHKGGDTSKDLMMKFTVDSTEVV